IARMRSSGVILTGWDGSTSRGSERAAAAVLSSYSSAGISFQVLPNFLSQASIFFHAASRSPGLGEPSIAWSWRRRRRSLAFMAGFHHHWYFCAPLRGPGADNDRKETGGPFLGKDAACKV